MPKLYCNVKTCEFHNHEFCEKERIKVSKFKDGEEHETICDSYKEKKHNRDKKFEIGTISSASPYSSVTCNVTNCKFNKDEICKASAIKVAGTQAHNKHETICLSFLNESI